jgi:hypothetical protein
MFGGQMFHQAHMRQRRQHFHQRTQRNHNHQQRRQGQEANNSGAVILVVVWMLLILFMGMGGAQNEPLFSIHKTRKYSVKRLVGFFCSIYFFLHLFCWWINFINVSLYN